MRKLVATVLFLAILVAIGSGVDVYLRHRAEHETATRIEQRVPGAHATVDISSFPFVIRLAASGTVPELTADVTGATVDGLSFANIHLDVHDLQVKRSSLLQGRVEVTDIRLAVIEATVDQAAVAKAVGLPVTFGEGTVGLAGIQAPAHISIEANTIHITVPGLPSISVSIPTLAVLPCVSSASIHPGELQLSCTTTTIPPALTEAAGTGS
jgi:hypothetical protein